MGMGISGFGLSDEYGAFGAYHLCLNRVERTIEQFILNSKVIILFPVLKEKLHLFIIGMAKHLREDCAVHTPIHSDLFAERQCRESDYTDLLDAFNAFEEHLHTPLVDRDPTDQANALPENTLLLIEMAELRADCQQLYNHVVQNALERRKAPRNEPFEALVADAGFANVNRTLDRLREWRSGYPRGLRRARERKALEAMLPDLLRQIGLLPSPDETLASLDRLLCRLPSTTGLFSLHQQQPQVMAEILKILSSSPELARLLEAYPHFLNQIIDGSAHVPLAGDEQLDAEFLRLAHCRHSVRYQHLIAERVNFHRFALGVQGLATGANLMEIAARLSDLGEAAVRAACLIARQQMQSLHGAVPGCELVVLALGRFGGRELTPSSDLDLVFVYTGDHSAYSDGARSLDANEYFGRMANWVSGLLTTVTPLGPLFVVDTRLRPWGGKGLLACSVSYFQRYFHENAMTWENMALTRARVITGSPKARAAVNAVLADQLQQFRDADLLVADAQAMRARMARHKPARHALDVKLVEGGLVDLEFAIHVNQLRHRIGFHANLGMAIRALHAQELVSDALPEAHHVLTQLLISLRTYTTDAQEPQPALRCRIAQACGFDSWPRLDAAYAHARRVVQSEWAAATRVQAVTN